MPRGNDDGGSIRVKVVPRSSVDRVAGAEGDLLRIALTAPPVDGKANKALVAFVAKRLKVPKRDVCVTAGHRARIKTVTVRGCSTERAYEELSRDL